MSGRKERQEHGKMGRVNRDDETLWLQCRREEKGSSKTDRTGNDIRQKKKVHSKCRAVVVAAVLLIIQLQV